MKRAPTTDNGDVVHYRFAEKPAVEIFAEEADRTAEQKCGNEDRPADFLKTVGQ